MTQDTCRTSSLSFTSTAQLLTTTSVTMEGRDDDDERAQYV